MPEVNNTKMKIEMSEGQEVKTKAEVKENQTEQLSEVTNVGDEI